MTALGGDGRLTFPVLWKADFCSALMVSNRASEFLPVCPDLPGRVPVYTLCLRVIINGTPLLGAECPSVDSKLYRHLFTLRTRKSNNSKNEIESVQDFCGTFTDSSKDKCSFGSVSRDRRRRGCGEERHVFSLCLVCRAVAVTDGAANGTGPWELFVAIFTPVPCPSQASPVILSHPPLTIAACFLLFYCSPGPSLLFPHLFLRVENCRSADSMAGLSGSRGTSTLQHRVVRRCACRARGPDRAQGHERQAWVQGLSVLH